MPAVYIKTYGCTQNQSDTEVMKGLLAQEDFALVDSAKEADCVIVNTCAVKDPAEKKALADIRNAGKPVIVTGCIPQAEPGRPDLAGFSLVGVRQLAKIVDAVEQTLEGHTVTYLAKEKNPRLNLPKVRKNAHIEIIPINEGCLGACTFCKTKLARGTLMSYEPEAIVRQFQSALDEGVSEFWLTSQDTGAFGLDLRTNIVELLERLCHLPSPHEYRIRLGMCNPDFAVKFLDGLCRVMAHPRMFKFLHLPIQCGSNKVLKDMNRLYTREDVLHVVTTLRAAVPALTLASDVICGYPTETEEDFEQTVTVCRAIDFDVLNINKFYPRAGTKAALLKPLPSQVQKARTRRLTALFNAHSNAKWVGRTCTVLFDEPGKPGTTMGRNDSYKPVVVDGVEPLGEFRQVRIAGATRDYLLGEML